MNDQYQKATDYYLVNSFQELARKTNKRKDIDSTSNIDAPKMSRLDTMIRQAMKQSSVYSAFGLILLFFNNKRKQIIDHLTQFKELLALQNVDVGKKKHNNDF